MPQGVDLWPLIMLYNTRITTMECIVFEVLYPVLHKDYEHHRQKRKILWLFLGGAPCRCDVIVYVELTSCIKYNLIVRTLKGRALKTKKLSYHQRNTTSPCVCDVPNQHYQLCKRPKMIFCLKWRFKHTLVDWRRFICSYSMHF